MNPVVEALFEQIAELEKNRRNAELKIFEEATKRSKTKDEVAKVEELTAKSVERRNAMLERIMQIGKEHKRRLANITHLESLLEAARTDATVIKEHSESQQKTHAAEIEKLEVLRNSIDAKFAKLREYYKARPDAIKLADIEGQIAAITAALAARDPEGGDGSRDAAVGDIGRLEAEVQALKAEKKTIELEVETLQELERTKDEGTADEAQVQEKQTLINSLEREKEQLWTEFTSLKAAAEEKEAKLRSMSCNACGAALGYAPMEEGED